MKKHLINSENNWFIFFTIELESSFELADTNSDDQDNLLPSEEDRQTSSDSLEQINENLVQQIVDPARTRAVDPARTRVDPARTRR
jgi:hypothetical protein